MLRSLLLSRGEGRKHSLRASVRSKLIQPQMVGVPHEEALSVFADVNSGAAAYFPYRVAAERRRPYGVTIYVGPGAWCT